VKQRSGLALGGLLAAAACSGETGTLAVTLTTAPGSTLLDGVDKLQLTLTNPPQVETAVRTNGRFSISLELPATGEVARLFVEGFDSGGARIANGASPPFPLGALEGRIVIYMASPLSIGDAPLSLAPARSELAIASLPYGTIVAGGRLESGIPSDAVTIYNAFDHSLLAGAPLPAPRAGLAMIVGNANAAYMFGGTDDAGAATASLWRFDTTTPPAGMYTDYGMKEGFARSGQHLVPIGNDHYLVTGSPIAELSSLDGAMTARDELPALPPAGVALTGNDAKLATIFAGPDGVVQFKSGGFTALDLPAAARADANVVALPGGKVLVVCGSTEGVLIDAASGAGEVLPGLPPTVRTGCAAAATSRHVVIAGGSEAGVVTDAVDVYDAATLASVGALQLRVPRTNAVAIGLPNDQILIAGGTDAAGLPVGTIELFTPPVQ
jgi:hypothetical protein